MLLEVVWSGLSQPEGGRIGHLRQLRPRCEQLATRRGGLESSIWAPCAIQVPRWATASFAVQPSSK
jgi:hypothetical protein